VQKYSKSDKQLLALRRAYKTAKNPSKVKALMGKIKQQKAWNKFLSA
jgi:hypothetical protein